jgi:hypothetical protein
MSSSALYAGRSRKVSLASTFGQSSCRVSGATIGIRVL